MDFFRFFVLIFLGGILVNFIVACCGGHSHNTTAEKSEAKVVEVPGNMKCRVVADRKGVKLNTAVNTHRIGIVECENENALCYIDSRTDKFNCIPKMRTDNPEHVKKIDTLTKELNVANTRLVELEKRNKAFEESTRTWTEVIKNKEKEIEACGIKKDIALATAAKTIDELHKKVGRANREIYECNEKNYKFKKSLDAIKVLFNK